MRPSTRPSVDCPRQTGQSYDTLPLEQVWVQGHKHSVDPTIDARCKLCSQVEASITHGIWTCPVVKARARTLRDGQVAAHKAHAANPDTDATALSDPDVWGEGIIGDGEGTAVRWFIPLRDMLRATSLALEDPSSFARRVPLEP